MFVKNISIKVAVALLYSMNTKHSVKGIQHIIIIIDCTYSKRIIKMKRARSHKNYCNFVFKNGIF